MQGKVAIGTQDFEKLRTGNFFYVDKTDFIKEWWEAGDDVTLITRPRRFGKTLNMSMVECFFSVKYANRGDLFEGLYVWKEEKYRELQGTYPVISISFARVKETSYTATKEKIYEIIRNLYIKYSFLRDSNVLTDADRLFFDRILSENMSDNDATSSLYQLSDYLCRYYGKKIIILLDEYDTPMQEAYVNEYWDEMVEFIRSLFNSSFKRNPALERAIMTGITRVSKESIFSDLNNLKVITTISNEYAASFGFTENEVFQALNDFGYSANKDNVKKWYDGFVFGRQKDIYNPWSIINFLDTGNFAPYWANTSSNSLIGKLIKEGSYDIKMTMEELLKGNTFLVELDDQIVFSDLDEDENAIWSLLIASGYLKVVNIKQNLDTCVSIYEIKITNNEVRFMFQNMIKGWFSKGGRSSYNNFIKALLLGDVKAMNTYMNRVALNTFSSFDVGNHPSEYTEPERFYHGFVLGLMVELADRYIILSNRESGFGRYDVVLEPLNCKDDAIILEFKVYDKDDEKTLADTVSSALKQIEEKKYETNMVAKGISKDRIRKYGFAFEGKKVLIG